MAPSTKDSARSGETDDLFNYDTTLDDAFRSPNVEHKTSSRNNSGAKAPKTGTSAAFDVDTEIKISRRRQAIGKLDENRYNTIDSTTDSRITLPAID
jgi:hypothetical protein